MAQKTFNIRQTVNLNGAISNRFATVVCEETEIDSILATLEGEYTVMVEHVSGGSDAVVSSYNLFAKATFKAEDTKNMIGGIYPSNGGLVIKNTIGPDDMTAILQNIHPFVDNSTKKPLASSIKTSIYAGAVASAGA